MINYCYSSCIFLIGYRYLKPHFLWIAVQLFLLDALVEGHLVAHPAPDFVDPIVVAVTQEVVVGNEPEIRQR